MNNGYQQFFKKAQAVADKKASKPERSIENPFYKISSESKSQIENKSSSEIKADRLRLKMKEKKLQRQKIKSEKRKISWKLAGLSLLGIVITASGLQYSGKIERYLKKIEISLGVASAAEENQDKSAGDKATAEKTGSDKAVGDKQKTEADKNVTEDTPKKEFSEEEINHFSKLNERKKELDAREEELNRMESEFATQKAELEKRLKELEGTRKQISSVLEEKVQGDDKKVETLVQVYTNMKPQQAAKVFETMDEDLAIEILGRMKRKPAAEILNLVKAEKAQVLSEKYAGYKRK